MMEQSLVPTLCAALTSATQHENDLPVISTPDPDGAISADGNTWTVERCAVLIRHMEAFLKDISSYACALPETSKGMQILEDVLDAVGAWGLAFYHAHHLQCQVLQVWAYRFSVLKSCQALLRCSLLR